MNLQCIYWLFKYWITNLFAYLFRTKALTHHESMTWLMDIIYLLHEVMQWILDEILYYKCTIQSILTKIIINLFFKFYSIVKYIALKNRIICIARIVKMFTLYYIYLIPHNSERCLLSSINHILHPIIEFTTII